MLTKSQIVERLAEDGAGGRQQVKHVLDSLAALAAEELEKGENFSIPGIVKIQWHYTAPRKKGEAYKKGETYNSFGTEKTAEADSPARKQKIKARAHLTSGVNRAVKDEKSGKRAITKNKK
jgi:nucleoid DNA-binding protein